MTPLALSKGCLCRIRRKPIEESIVPDLMEDPGPLGEGSHGLPQKFDLYVTTAAVMILPGVQRLVQIPDKVH